MIGSYEENVTVSVSVRTTNFQLSIANFQF
jgi:hypothetical protein